MHTNKAENNFKIGMDTFNYEYVAKIFDGFDFDCNHITHTRRYKYSSAGLEADKMKQSTIKEFADGDGREKRGE